MAGFTYTDIFRGGIGPWTPLPPSSPNSFIPGHAPLTEILYTSLAKDTGVELHFIDIFLEMAVTRSGAIIDSKLQKLEKILLTSWQSRDRERIFFGTGHIVTNSRVKHRLKLLKYEPLHFANGVITRQLSFS